MALSDLTFKLYNDTALTSAFNGTLSVTHETDLSDGTQDFVLYLGSATASRRLQANSNPGVDNITLTPTDAITDWTAATAYVVGKYIEPTTPNGLKYKCTTAGTSHASTEPTWPTTGIGSTVADGTAVWTLLGARHATTEIKLATTNGGLAGATAGAALSIGTSLTSLTANRQDVHIRITNAVATVNNNTGQHEIAININEVLESEVI